MHFCSLQNDAAHLGEKLIFSLAFEDLFLVFVITVLKVIKMHTGSNDLLL